MWSPSRHFALPVFVLGVLFLCATCSDDKTSYSGTLYVLNSGPNNNDGALLRYANAASVDGDTAPTATVSGATTTLLCPYFGYLDTNADRIYIADPCSAAINVYDNASSQTGNVAPNRRLTGALTTFPAAGTSAMLAVTVDTTRDILYVSASNSGLTTATVLVFDHASTVNGNVAPDRAITTPPTAGQMLSYNHGLHIDTTNDRLWVASSADSSLVSFDSASTATGSTAPTRTIGGSSTGLSGAFPTDVKLDNNGNVLVSCRTPTATPTSGAVVIYSAYNLSSTGLLNIAPGRVPFTGSKTTLAGPYMLAWRRDMPQFYVANAFGNSVLVFDHFDPLVGDTNPNRSLKGASTGLTPPGGATTTRTATGVMIDFTR